MRSVSILAALITIFVGVSISWGEEGVVAYGRTVERGGLRYEVNSEEPFTGTAVLYYENGQKKAEIEWRDGKGHGKATSWYENGQKMVEGELRDGKPHGKATSWYENGQKKAEGEVRDGKRHGKATTWYENGQKKREAEYQDGKLISEKCWDENGNLEPCE